MSYELTPERLQGLAVKCAATYLTKQASLSQAIAKEAQDLELNPEQIKRTIEATNTVAYLRQLEDSKDRTFEFPLADYKEVMAHMVLPEKQAADKEDSEKGKDDESKQEKDDESDSKKDKKETDDKDEDKEDNKESPSFSSQEKVAMLSRETLRCVQVMEKMAYDKVGIQMELEAAAAKVAKDPYAFEKIAYVAEAKDVTKLTLLCGLEKQATSNSVFTNRDLMDVQHLDALLKQAQEMVAEEGKMIEFLSKSAEVLEKQALLGTVAGLAGKAIGSLARGAVNVATAPVKGVAKNFGAFKASAKSKGFKDMSEAAADFDKIKASQGTAAAKKAYDGAKPNIVHRKGLLGTADFAATAATGLTATHTNHVWDTLQKNN